MGTTDESEREPMVDKRAASHMNDAGSDTAPGTRETNQDQPAGDLTDALERADQNFKNWQRTAADFANYKRRIEQERGEMARFASAALVINVLPIFDDLDRAVSTVDANLAGLNWVQGILAIHRKFASLLQAMDVKEIAADGAMFDPALHEAVANQPGDEGKILAVVQKGYTLADKVIRPAMVIVGGDA